MNMTTTSIAAPHSESLAAASSLGTPSHVLVIDTLPDFEAIAEKWDRFIIDAGIRNLSAMHDWLSVWLKYFLRDGELCVLIVCDEQGRWQGVAPFQIVRGRSGASQRLLRYVQFIGTQPTVFDWMDIVLHPQADEGQVLALMADCLSRRKNCWDVLELCFCSNQARLERFYRCLNPKGGENANSDTLYETMPIPWFPLPETEAQYLESRPKKTRLKINRHRNALLKEHDEGEMISFKRSTPESRAETRRLLQHFVEGHIGYWKEKGVKSDFVRYPELYGFYAELLERGERRPHPNAPALEFSALELKGEPMSFHLGFWQGDSYLFHMSYYEAAFERYSPGTLHTEALILYTLNRQGKSFSFGRGDEAYKRMWTKTMQSLWNLRVFRTPFHRLLWNVDTVLKRLTGRKSV